MDDKKILCLCVMFLVLCVSASNDLGHFRLMRIPPDLRLRSFAEQYDMSMEVIVPLLRSLYSMIDGLDNFPFEFKSTGEFVVFFTNAIFEYFNCISYDIINLKSLKTAPEPKCILYKSFDKFRNFSRQMITEMDYGYLTLLFAYVKKEISVINKIIDVKGLHIFLNTSDCIRMRIGQYFMPNFVGNDTSNCSDIDWIILSFSDQPVDPSIDFISLLTQLLIICSLCYSTYFAYKLLIQEHNKFQMLEQLALEEQLESKLLPEICLEQRKESSLSLYNVNYKAMSSLKFPLIKEESNESPSYDSRAYSSLTSGAKVRGSSAFILSEVASKNEL
ncbi:unnamed protein product [Moneuplotes crassus]|uniref:Uncharacterized protein n=1 Tax=Euplotes crassus TaxID=5936 RepID=A0AAD1XNG8_EUPCR|nr:unnamed protein product [Moneuplotes crassus]